MELAASKRYSMFWDIHMPTLVEISLRSISYGFCTDYAKELLGKFYSINTVMYLTEKVKNMDEKHITAFVDNFIFAYKADDYEQFYFVRASLFGKSEISINGVKIPDTVWKTKKVKNFLEYLLLNSGSTISKETLAEALWPNSDSASAIASQRTALYHLRRILSKYNAEITKKNAFIYETLQGLQIKKCDALELDIHEFLNLYEEIKNIPLQEQKQSDNLERMIFLYKGDLLEGSDYGDLVLYERERFKSIFLDVCERLSSIYSDCGKLQQAEEILRRALIVDPYNEIICLKLLKTYMAQGRRSKAVKFYYSFKKQLEQELGTKIDKRLTEAIQSSKLQS